jgi:hypothetical protein
VQKLGYCNYDTKDNYKNYIRLFFAFICAYIGGVACSLSGIIVEFFWLPAKQLDFDPIFRLMGQIIGFLVGFCIGFGWEVERLE